MSTEADPGDTGGHVDDMYERLGGIGGCAFSTVQKARNRETNAIVAIKHLRLDDNDAWEGVPAQAIRDVSLLRDFVHPNIVQLLSIQIDAMDCNLIFEYVDTELQAVLRSHRKAGRLMIIHQVATYTQDLLSGIHACHAHMFVHHNLKLQNILVGEKGLKICDAGLARVYSLLGRPYTDDVMTLWYRAPERLLGGQTNGPEVDMWSAGCIIAEMATCHPAFPGDSEIGTIFKVLELLGTPTEESWPGFSRLEHWKDTFPRWPPTGLAPIREMQPELGGAGMDLITHLLDLNPQSRLSARRAKSHAFCSAPQ